MATIFQHGTLELIMNGLYDGTTSLATILDNGDFGIGTLDRLNGELTIMNGKVYQTNAGGITQEIRKLELTTPFHHLILKQVTIVLFRNQSCLSPDLKH